MIKCKICGKEIKNVGVFSRHLIKEHNISYLDYMVQYEGFEIPKCPICGKDRIRINGISFRKTCGSTICNKKHHIQTCLEKYGTTSYTKTKECQDKKKKTCLERYGVENPRNFEYFKEKSKKTCLKKYGTENYFQSKIAREKIKKTNLEKYGVEYFTQTKEYGDIIKKFRLNKNFKVYAKRYADEFDNIRIENDEVIGTCKKCGHDEHLNVYNAWQRKFRCKVPVCTQCNPTEKKYSCAEKELCDFIKSIYSGSILENDYSVLCEGPNGWPKELDIYLHEKKIAFEFEGNAFHGYGRRSSNRTRFDDAWKMIECRRLGINLIQVWESDWDNNREEVENEIKLLFE